MDLLVEISYWFIGGIYSRKGFAGNDEKNGM